MGDGAMYFFLADLIVAPEFRSSGYGDRLMHAVTSYFDRSAMPGATITLVPLVGREPFYEKFDSCAVQAARLARRCTTPQRRLPGSCA
jgi:predicted N-acetyltransferase YhbS